jgi:hypothetical protein
LNAGEKSIHHFCYVLVTHQKLYRISSEKCYFTIKLFLIKLKKTTPFQSLT